MNNTKGNSPGPGSYDAKLASKGPTYVLSGRHAARKPDPVPGPGQYNAEKSEKQPTMVKMLRKDDRPWTAAGAPSMGGVGPGSYDIRHEKEKQGGKFSKEERKNEMLKHASQKNPGPGAYRQEIGTVTSATPSFSYFDLHNE